jgi:hypothetical protein
VKKQARVACHPSYRSAPLGMLEGVFRALSPWREGALGAPPSIPTRLRRSPHFPPQLEGAGGTFSDGISKSAVL